MLEIRPLITNFTVAVGITIQTLLRTSDIG